MFVLKNVSICLVIPPGVSCLTRFRVELCGYNKLTAITVFKSESTTTVAFGHGRCVPRNKQVENLKKNR